MQWRQFSKSYMATGLKSHVCMRTLFMLSSSVDSIILSQHTFPPPGTKVSMTVAIPCHTPYWRLCAAESELRSGDDALDFTSHSASICKHISVVLFYFDNVIMMVQETCFKSTCHQFDPARNVAIHSCEERLWWSDNHSSYACSDYVAYPHHKEVKFWSMFYYRQMRLSPAWSRLEITQSEQ